MCLLKWCVDFVSLVFNYFDESQNIEMNNKCQLNGWNAIQRTKWRLFIATLVGLFFNYTIQLQVTLAKNTSCTLLLMWTSCKMLHNKHNDDQGYIIIGPMRVEVVYVGCLLLSHMTNPNKNWDAFLSSRKFIHKTL